MKHLEKSSRAYRRNPVYVPMMVHQEEQTFFGNLLDFSLQGGLFKAVGIRMPKDGLFTFTIVISPAHGEEIMGKARVVSDEGGAGQIAFMYEDMSAAHFELLKRVNLFSKNPEFNLEAMVSHYMR